MEFMKPEARWAAKTVSGAGGRVCSVSNVYTGDVELKFVRSVDSYGVHLSFPDKRFDEKQVYMTDVFVDVLYSLSARGQVLNAREVVVGVSDGQAFEDALRGAREVSVGFGETLYIFQLNDLVQMGRMFDVCARSVSQQDVAAQGVPMPLMMTRFDESSVSSSAGPVSKVPSLLSDDVFEEVVVEVGVADTDGSGGVSAFDAFDDNQDVDVSGGVVVALDKTESAPVRSGGDTLSGVLGWFGSLFDFTKEAGREVGESGIGVVDVASNVPAQASSVIADAAPSVVKRVVPKPKNLYALGEGGQEIVNADMSSDFALMRSDEALVEPDVDLGGPLFSDGVELPYEEMDGGRSQIFLDGEGVVSVDQEMNRMLPRKKPVETALKNVPEVDEEPKVVVVETIEARPAPGYEGEAVPVCAEAPQGIKEIEIYATGNRNYDESQEIIESLKLQISLLEREKEAVRKRVPEVSSPLSVLRSCRKEELKIQELVQEVRSLENKNFALTQNQSNVLGVAGQEFTMEELDSLQILVEELRAENEDLKSKLDDMETYKELLDTYEKEGGAVPSDDQVNGALESEVGTEVEAVDESFFDDEGDLEG